MPSLWSDLRRRWLDAPGRLPAREVDRLCPHLRRDIGLTALEPHDPEGAPAADPLADRLQGDPIRDRNFSKAPTFLTLQPCR
ncbi:hypothetical protein [Azospirillum thermophilum]|uniref:Uncharacterized protein n=1 Tax=Azospirillum thermophilum TaxID=2202148 RepID=A0A2S2CU13_9PROT|nr:hypothetical protein [Azospirillum thermophilum]AWK87860.1 hypothetical protein DEW08_18185 [Azospirillum thermophilum]